VIEPDALNEPRTTIEQQGAAPQPRTWSRFCGCRDLARCASDAAIQRRCRAVIASRNSGAGRPAATSAERS